jgi:hypothetical protein
MRSVALLSLLFGCPQEQDGKPPKLEGHWELMQIETSSGVLEGRDVVLSQFKGCDWARRTFTFTDGKLKVENDILCRGKARDEYYGCQVAVEVPATWDELNGVWMVRTPVRGRARTRGLEEGALDVPTSCTVEVAAGQYKVARIRSEKWKWEVGVPDGTVYRLRTPDTDAPDFVLAMREARTPAAPPAPAPTEGGQQ